MFLHANAGHLWGNMVFFWAFAPVGRGTAGTKKTILLYLATGLLGNMIAVFIHLISLQKLYHVLGASGAVSGIMGVFLVRCYFKKLIIPIPLLGLLSVKLKVNSLLLLGFFFLRDVQGGVGQIVGSGHRHRLLGARRQHGGRHAAFRPLEAAPGGGRGKVHRDRPGGPGEQFSRRDSVDSLQAALQLNPENECRAAGPGARVCHHPQARGPGPVSRGRSA